MHSHRRPWLHGLLFVLLIGSGGLFYQLAPWGESLKGVQETPFREERAELPPPGSLAQEEEDGDGFCFEELFEKGALRCVTRIKITGRLPIVITRAYQDGRVERICLRVLRADDAAALHALVVHSQAHLMPFMPGIFKVYGQSQGQTSQSIGRDFQRMRAGGFIRLGVFFQEGNGPERLIGQVGCHSFGYYRPGSVDGMYWKGDPAYIGEVKGVMRVGIKALFHHLNALGKTRHFNLVVHEDNKDSLRIPIHFGMRKIKASEYRQWGYREHKAECIIYSFTAQEWEEKIGQATLLEAKGQGSLPAQKNRPKKRGKKSRPGQKKPAAHKSKAG